jgi:eukaryotic-like serine/threonine-protein kinase
VTGDRWRQIEDLCHAALAQAAEARPAFVTRACADDEALKREVESLLAQERDTDGFLSASPVAGAASALIEQPEGSLVGRHFGSYIFRALLGVGGMGEVYRAHDDTLGRDVAIKVLRPAFTADPQRRALFEREARMLATLNHPHIGAIYGETDVGGVRGLVLELVEGETLAARLTRGAIPPRETLPLARQIAAALEAAHDRGIIHRDLKPSNITITADGVVKVLDFGLATLSDPAAAGSGAVQGAEVSTARISAATISVAEILGTAAYMAPERAKGRPADKRSDIWSFGCVLFEMLTGTPAFAGSNAADTLAAVVNAAPDWEALPVDLPPTLLVLLTKSLEKDRAQRITGISVVHFLLTHEAPTGSSGDTALPRRTGRPRPRSGYAPLYAAAIVGTILAAGYIISMPRTTSPPPAVSRFVVDLGTGDQFTNTGRHLIAISSDGKRIAYAANNRLYLRSLDQLEATPIRGTDGAGIASPRSPFFSPDGQWVGFWSDSQLKKISMFGGSAVSLCAADNPFGATWGDDGTILYSQGSGGVWRVSADGGKPENIIKVTDGQLAQGPQLLPGGRAVLVTIGQGPGTWDQAQIVVQALDTGLRKVVMTGGTDARYTRTGHLVYGQRGTLMAVRLDARSYSVIGSVVPVEKGVSQPGVTGAVQFSVSDNGTLIFVPGTNSSFPLRTLAWVDRKGVESVIPAERRAYAYPRLSPDGTRIALDVAEENRDIWVWDLARTTLTRLTSDPGIDQFPVWTPDSKCLLFGSTRANGVSNLYRQLADGTQNAERLFESADEHFPTAVTPDGTGAILAAGGQGDLMLVRFDAPRQLDRLTQTPFSERNGTVSPDGRWLAYSADDSGHHEIYVRPFPKTGTNRWQVSTGGGLQPLWSRSGRELFFRTLTGILMRVTADRGEEWSVRPPTMLLDARAYVLGTMAFSRTYDVSPDDSRFLFVKPDPLDQGATPRMIVVQNWFEDLKRRVPP